VYGLLLNPREDSVVTWIATRVPPRFDIPAHTSLALDLDVHECTYFPEVAQIRFLLVAETTIVAESQTIELHRRRHGN
jgi:hypothetical protein